jgi:hypothetical protein
MLLFLVQPGRRMAVERGFPFCFLSTIQSPGLHLNQRAYCSRSRSIEIRGSELAMILDGIDVSKLKRVRADQEPIEITSRIEL